MTLVATRMASVGHSVEYALTEGNRYRYMVPSLTEIDVA